MYEMIEPFSFLIVISLGIFYYKKIAKKYKLYSQQQTAFYIGLVLIFLLYSSPFHLIAKHYLFSAHMFQLAITFFVIVPLLVISIPAEVYEKLSWNYKFRSTMKIAGNPFLIFIVFNLLFSIYFVPNVFNTLHEFRLLYIFYYLILLLYAFFMWTIVIGTFKRIYNLKPLYRIAFIFFISMALMPIGFYHLLVLSARYAPYIATEAQFIPILTNVYDQQLAGGLLKLIQLSSFIYVMYQIVKRWAIEMQEKDGDPLDDRLRVVQGIVIRTNQSTKNK